jgi:hypothetical protein
MHGRVDVEAEQCGVHEKDWRAIVAVVDLGPRDESEGEVGVGEGGDSGGNVHFLDCLHSSTSKFNL